MLWASSPVVGLDNFGGFSNLNDCVTCWGSQAGASARSGLAHPSPHPPKAAGMPSRHTGPSPGPEDAVCHTLCHWE